MKHENERKPEPAGPGASPDRGAMSAEPGGLEQLVERIRRIDADRDPVDVEAVLSQIGRRSFGAIVLFAGIVVLAPLIGDIPGVPTLVALLVAIASVQLLAGRRYFWLPDFLLKRSISRTRLEKALNVTQGPARFTDRFLRRRLVVFVSPAVTRLIAAAVLGVALVMPLLELIPFSANLAGIALSAFGVALIARDGLFALISLLVTTSVFAVVVYWAAQL